MKFRIYYTKLGNQFFFVSNLAEWHFSCRKKYNQEWIKQTGVLTIKEKDALKKIVKILKKYAFWEKNGKKIYLGIPFITSSDKRAWMAIEKWVNKEEFKKIRQIFKIFDERFNKIWVKSAIELKKAKKILNISLNNKKEIKEILEDLSSLYQQKINDELSIKIYLFHHLVENSFGGGANLNKNQLTLDCPSITPNTSSEERAIRTLLHELIHNYFETPQFKNLLINCLDEMDYKKLVDSSIFKEVKSVRNIINEMIVESLLPNGYLAEKYFHFKVAEKIKNIEEIENKKDKSLADYRLLSAYHMYSISKNYLDNKKPLDEKYINEIIKIFLKFQ